MSDRRAVVVTSERCVERVIGKRMAEKAEAEAAEKVCNKQIQVSNFGLLQNLSEVNLVV